ncbi:MAG: hypothetical protein QM831_03665 [Kofleriaceae bacterium]
MADLAQDRVKFVIVIGAICAAMPLFFTVSEAHDGVYRDWVALGGGILAAICGVIGLGFAAKSKVRVHLITAAVITLLGVLHILRGVGMVAA